MAIEVDEEAMDVVGSLSVLRPLACVVAEERLVGEVRGSLSEGVGTTTSASDRSDELVLRVRPPCAGALNAA